MKILITGGCGFIGSNLALAFSKDHDVTVFDSLTRKGSEKNLEWLTGNKKIKFVKGEITDFPLVTKLVKGQDVVLHLAAQVAVTSSVSDPRRDFEVNALGTLNILEAARSCRKLPLITYASTNKVYGNLKNARYAEKSSRFIDKEHLKGVSEEEPLDFYSPYGCSKGTGDSYTKDYARIYNLPTIVFRKSCIYGTHQYGTEDQGWVAYFVRQALSNKEITLYGNGKQVRDLLFIDDLMNLYQKAITRFAEGKHVSGVFNVGGGVDNTVSLLELIAKLEKLLGKKIKLKLAHERPGDQKVYITDIRKVSKEFSWKPKIGVEAGVDRLVEWVRGLVK